MVGRNLLMVMVIPCRSHIQVKEQPLGLAAATTGRRCLRRLQGHIRINLTMGLIIQQQD